MRAQGIALLGRPGEFLLVEIVERDDALEPSDERLQFFGREGIWKAEEGDNWFERLTAWLANVVWSGQLSSAATTVSSQKPSKDMPPHAASATATIGGDDEGVQQNTTETSFARLSQLATIGEMDNPITAIYDSGVFRPLDPVDLADGVTVSLSLTAINDPALNDKMDAAAKQALLDFIGRMEALPDNSPDDDFSNRDHDRVIYGV